MPGDLVVDLGALRQAAEHVDRLATSSPNGPSPQDVAGGQGVVMTLVSAECVLADASCAGAVGDLTEAVVAVHADITTALRSLAGGLRTSADAYAAQDAALAAAPQPDAAPPAAPPNAGGPGRAAR